MSRSSIYWKLDRTLFFFLNSVLILDFFWGGGNVEFEEHVGYKCTNEYMSVELINNQYLGVRGRNKLHKESLNDWSQKENRFKGRCFQKGTGGGVECIWKVRQKKGWTQSFCFIVQESLGSKLNWVFRSGLRVRKWTLSNVNYYLQKLDYKWKGEKEERVIVTVCSRVMTHHVVIRGLFYYVISYEKNAKKRDVFRLKRFDSIYRLGEEVNREGEEEGINGPRSLKKRRRMGFWE